MAAEPCVFCDIAAGEAPAKVHFENDEFMIFEPLNPVTRGHLLVIPKAHRVGPTDDPDLTAATMRYAAWWASGGQCNLITSDGADATQTVFHLHIHIVPRRPYDDLKLPWSPP